MCQNIHNMQSTELVSSAGFSSVSTFTFVQPSPPSNSRILFISNLSFTEQISTSSPLSPLETTILHCLCEFDNCWVVQSCLTLCGPMDCSTPGFPVHHQLPELAHTHVHSVGDAIQPSYPLSSPSPPAFSLSQHQSLFPWVSSSYQVDKVLEFQLQNQSFQWIFRTDFLHDGLVWSPCNLRLSRVFSNTTDQKHQFFDAWLSL